MLFDAINLPLWWAFAAATFVICGSPGPNMLHAMASGAKHGLRRSAFTMAGLFSGVMLLISASVAGVGVMVQASPVLFAWLRYAGAAYLIYLGVQVWRAPVDDRAAGHAVTADVRAAALFRSGFWVGLSNPKALLFAAAFFPQFIDPNAGEWPQLLVLLATFSVLEIGWYIAYAAGGQRLASAMRKAGIKRLFNRVTGGLFAAFGMLMAAKSA